MVDISSLMDAQHRLPQPGQVRRTLDGLQSFWVSGLNADFKLEQTGPDGGEKGEHLLVQELRRQLKVEVGDAVVVLRQIPPDCHGVVLGAVEGPVHQLDLAHACL